MEADATRQAGPSEALWSRLHALRLAPRHLISLPLPGAGGSNYYNYLEPPTRCSTKALVAFAVQDKRLGKAEELITGWVCWVHGIAGKQKQAAESAAGDFFGAAFFMCFLSASCLEV